MVINLLDYQQNAALLADFSLILGLVDGPILVEGVVFHLLEEISVDQEPGQLLEKTRFIARPIEVDKLDLITR